MPHTTPSPEQPITPAPVSESPANLDHSLLDRAKAYGRGLLVATGIAAGVGGLGLTFREVMQEPVPGDYGPNSGGQLFDQSTLPNQNPAPPLIPEVRDPSGPEKIDSKDKELEPKTKPESPADTARPSDSTRDKSSSKAPKAKDDVAQNKGAVVGPLEKIKTGELGSIIVPEITESEDELIEFDPRKEVVTPEISKIMEENVVKLDSLGCSGFLIRNQTTGHPTGVLTAEHCDLGMGSGMRVSKSDGTAVLNLPWPPEASTGNKEDDLTYVGNLTKFALNGPLNTTKDVAIGAFEGSSLDEVRSQSPLNPDRARSLKTGDIIYVSGWPIYDTEDEESLLSRQEFAMPVLGIKSVDVNFHDSSIHNMEMVFTAVKQNKEGAACWPGISGSAAFAYEKDNTATVVGVASSYYDFSQINDKKASPEAQEEALIKRMSLENFFGVSLEGYDAVCGFTFEPPTPDNGMVEAIVGDPDKDSPVDEDSPVEEDVPINEDPEFAAIQKLVDEYRANFYKPDFKRQVLDAYLYVDEKGHNDSLVDRPAAYHDAGSGTTLLAWYDASNQDKLAVMVVPDPKDLKNVKFYKRSPETVPRVTEANGAIVNENDYFKNEQGVVFGQALANNTKPTGSTTELVVADGRLIFKTINEPPKPKP